MECRLFGLANVPVVISCAGIIHSSVVYISGCWERRDEQSHLMEGIYREKEKP